MKDSFFHHPHQLAVSHLEKLVSTKEYNLMTPGEREKYDLFYGLANLAQAVSRNHAKLESIQTELEKIKKSLGIR